MVIFIVIFLASIAALFYILIKNFKKKTKIVSSVLCVVLAVSSIVSLFYFNTKFEISLTNFKADTFDIYLNENKLVTFSCKVNSKKKIENEDVAVYGEGHKFISFMNDEGINGDISANDGIYTGQATLSSDEFKLKKYYASAFERKSNTFEINFYRDLTSEEFSAFDKLHTKITSLSFSEAIEYIEKSEEIDTYSIDEKHKSITYHTKYHITGIWEDKDNSFKGSGEFSIPMHSGRDYDEVNKLVSKLHFTSNLRNKDIIVIRPFRSTQFLYDDFKQSGTLLADALNSNVVVKDNEDVTISEMKKLNDYGIVLIDSHGTLIDSNNPHIVIGEKYKENQSYSSDYSSGTINCVGSEKNLTIGSRFIEKYYQNNSLINSFLFLGSCYSSYLNDLPSSLTSVGAESVVGFTDKVTTGYCNNTLFETVINSMLLSAFTLKNGVNITKQNYGNYDPSNSKCELTMQGNISYKVVNEIISTGTISGILKEQGTNSPISNREVKIYNGFYSSDNSMYTFIDKTKTNDKGNFQFSLPTGTYTLIIDNAGGNSNSDYHYDTVKMKVKVKAGVINILLDDILLKRIENDMTKKNYTWLVEPTIEADDIIVFDNSKVPDNGTDARGDKTAHKKDYTIINKGGKYDFINYSGDLISDKKFNSIHDCICGAINLYNSTDNEFNPLYIDENLSLKTNPLGCQHGSPALGHIYDFQTQKINSDWQTDTNSCLRKPATSTPYAIFNNKKLVTDFIFEDILSDNTGNSGLVACKKEGKWGYYNIDGKEIISCQFDDINMHITSKGMVVYNGMDSSHSINVFLPTEGYIAVNKNGGYGYYNTKGEEVIPCGEFEQARPVYGGKAWVKKDGKWGVILIENEKVEISDNETTENTNAPTNQNLSAKLSIPDDVKQFNGHSYYVFDDLYESWEEAEAYCESLGGHLAVINNEEENKAVFDIMKELGYDSAYFGYTDSGNEGSWKWVNGESSQYENWSDGEPNNERGIENYAMFYYQSPDYEWNDGDFDSTVNGGKAFICEWDQDLSENTEAKNGETSTTTSDERDIVLVLDTSSSMSGTPLDETKKASNKFIETILKNDASIGIVTYNYEANIDSDFSVDDVRLKNSVSEISSGGDTNIESGLETAYDMLKDSKAKKKIIVLMSDGKPNEGKEGDDLITYAEDIKKNNIYIYTLGFFEDLDDDKSSAQILMEEIASDGCHYEVDNADDLIFFFGDIADQLNGQKYIYVRLACPVDVYVSHNGEVLNSAEDDISVRANFGTLTFEDIEDSEGHEENDENNIKDQIKILRLKEGEDYNVQIKGYGRGKMDYTIGFMDENGEYSDLRKFKDIRVTKRTIIDTVAQNSESTVLNIDKDGDGKYDLKYKATKNGNGEIVEYTYIYYIIISGVFVLLFATAYICIKRYKRKKL